MSLKLIVVTLLTTSMLDCLPEADANVRGNPRPYSPCKVNQTVADCSHQGLSKVPSTLPTTITVLLMNDNNIFSLMSRGFSKFENLTHLDISNNLIQNVFDDSFKGLKHLKKLHMQLNNVPLLQKALSVLHSLEELYVDGRLNMTFDKHFLNLPNLTNLSVSGKLGNCKIRNIFNHTFENVPYLKLLDLSRCNLRRIDSGAFLPLRSIEVLDISHNRRLHFNNFQNATFGLANSSIQVLRANAIVKRYSICNILYKQHTQYLKKTRLQRLYFDDNRVEGLGYGTLLHLPETLWYVSVRYNRFSNGPYISMLAEITNVTHLHIGNDESKSFPHLPFLNHPIGENSIPCNSTSDGFCQSGIQKYLEYKSEHLPPSTQQSKYYKTIIYLPPQLQMLQTTCKRLQFNISSLTFSPNNITTLILNCNLLTHWIGPVEGLERLKILDLSDNLARTVSTFFFPSFPQLKVLNISLNFIGSMMNQGSQSLIFDNLTSLEVLDMSLNSIHSLPEDIFRDLISVKILNLSTNTIYLDLPLRVAHMKNLQLLDLSNNQIRWFSEILMHDLDILAESNNISINMLLNPIACTCDNLGFLRWMRSSKMTFLHVYNYTCAFEDDTFGKIGTFEDIVIRLQNECISLVALIIGGVFGFLIVCGILVGVLAYRCRWNLRYWYCNARMNYQKQSLLDAEDESLTYDAFVSYAEEDEYFVVNDMKNRVETLAGMKLNIANRDFPPGQIPNNILSAIKSSRKTVVVLSRSFLQNDVCQYEMQMANIESIKTRKNMLIMIMYEDISVNDIPKEVEYRLKSESYITYPHSEDDARTDLFWRRFIRSLQSN